MQRHPSKTSPNKRERVLAKIIDFFVKMIHFCGCIEDGNEFVDLDNNITKDETVPETLPALQTKTSLSEEETVEKQTITSPAVEKQTKTPPPVSEKVEQKTKTPSVSQDSEEDYDVV